MSSPLWVANRHTSSYIDEAAKAAESVQIAAEIVQEKDNQVWESPKPFFGDLIEKLKRALISPLFIETSETE
jgi:hypothetical protein